MDRVHYEKLVNVGNFEHIRLTVDVEVVNLKGSDEALGWSQVNKYGAEIDSLSFYCKVDSA